MFDVAEIRAAAVAYLDFAQRIKTESHSVPGVGEQLRDERNYVVDTKRSVGGFEVYFYPVHVKSEHEFRGGGYEYFVESDLRTIRWAHRMK